ncbi:MAG TPA: hypothetical protein VG476_05530 [Acidimicrobiales bacterium]|nr:hypothetical protein [Acidimicrobiales bacterium]
MPVVRAVSATAVIGALAAACGGASSSGTNRLNNPATLASVIQSSAQHKIDSGTSGLPAGTRVTGVTCANTRRLDYACAVNFNTVPGRSLQVSVSPGGRSYVITAGDL